MKNMVQLPPKEFADSFLGAKREPADSFKEAI